jgi:hypothetical protein
MVGALIFMVDSLMYFVSGLQCRVPEMEEPARQLSRRMSVKVVFKPEYERSRKSVGEPAVEMQPLHGSEGRGAALIS